MPLELYRTQPVFRQSLERCDNILQPLLCVSLFNVIYPDSDADKALFDETGYAHAQSTLFAIEYALAELLRSWGVEPVAVLGHDIGEYAAAVVAGVFSLEDSLKLMAERLRLNSGPIEASALTDFKRALAQVQFSMPQIGLVSTVTGQF